jgi:hypothetical protein
MVQVPDAVSVKTIREFVIPDPASSFCATTVGVGSNRKRYVSKIVDDISIVTVSPAVPSNCQRST